MCARERVAQSVEHMTFNHGVVGSIPTALTKEKSGLSGPFSLPYIFFPEMLTGKIWRQSYGALAFCELRAPAFEHQ
jgi:hypothetical protein